MKKAKSIKRKRCKACRKLFAPRFNTFQKVCSPICAIAYAQTEDGQKFVAKQKRKQTRADKERIKTRADWIKDVQRSFNKWIKLRDKDEPCICCSNVYTGKMDAGHYRTTGAHPELRFNPDNCFKQRSRPCNKDKSGNNIETRKGMVERIGEKRVQSIESSHSAAKWTVDDLKRMKKEYLVKIKELESVSALCR